MSYHDATFRSVLILLMLGIATGGSAFAQATSAPGVSKSRPNVVILFPDQLRWCSVGCYGDPVIRSPNIDRLAAGGVRFSQAFSNFPVCSPARSVLLSGCYARSNGVMHNQDQEAGPDRPTNRTRTLAETLRDAGYDTALVGKWHLAPTPQALGFTYSLRCNMRHRYYKQTFRVDEGKPYIFDDYGPYHETETAVNYIRDRHERPFFLFLTLGPPHMPVSEMPEKYLHMYDPAKVPLRDNVWKDGKLAYDEEWFKIYMWDFQYYQHKDTFDRKLPEGMTLRDLTALYYGQITAVDDCIGRVLAALKEAGLEDNTIVLLTSDHGDLLGSHQLFNKGRHYEEAIHVPMILRYPQAVKPRVIGDQVASLVDMMPTLLGLCGVAAPESVQGTSLAPAVTGKLGSGKSIGENAAFIETGSQDGVRTLKYLYAVGRKANAPEDLYDLDKDPFEMKNVAGDAAYVEVLKSLRSRVQAWRQRTPALSPER
jgi:arylsulfatase A-like enzyme